MSIHQKKNNNYGTDQISNLESTKEKSKRELSQYINNDYIKNSRDNLEIKNDGIIVNDINTNDTSDSSDLESCYSHDSDSEKMDSDDEYVDSKC